MVLLLAACLDVAPPAAPADPTAPGPWSVAHRTVAVTSDGRSLPVSVWYPTAASPTSTPVPDAFLEEPFRSTYAALLESAGSAESADPAGLPCPSTEHVAAVDAAPVAGAWPLVVMSHCTGCTRFSTFTVAQRLASHGIAVAAPDHVGDTLADDLAGVGLPLDTETLELRRRDLIATVDALLAGDGGLTVDPLRVGAVGHSFGSVTVGRLAQTDPRIGAVVGLAAPMENPLLPGVEMAALDLPLLLVVAQEDHSISELGNLLIRSNWEAAPGPAWKAEIADAGHWSVSDIVAITDDLRPGCGDDLRQLGGAPFTYLPPAEGRAVTASLVTAFFLDAFEVSRDGLDALTLPGVEVARR